jgi:diketogulonate reductase-like aldo/keto reductase
MHDSRKEERMATRLRTIDLPLGDSIPVLCQGTSHLGRDEARWDDEVAALQLGFDLGATSIDTSETYGAGKAEELVGDAIAGRREQVFLVSHVQPSHFGRRTMPVACEQSLRRLGTDWIDLYLLHTRGFELLEETLDTLADLVRREMIAAWGVSHFGLHDLMELVQVRDGAHLQVEQVPYSLARRGIESGLLPWCRSRGVPLMACSPLEQGRLLGHHALRGVAERHGATEAQVALAWVMGHGGVIAVSAASSPEHLRENVGTVDLALTEEDLAELDDLFAPPASAQLDTR